MKHCTYYSTNIYDNADKKDRTMIPLFVDSLLRCGSILYMSHHATTVHTGCNHVDYLDIQSEIVLFFGSYKSR